MMDASCVPNGLMHFFLLKKHPEGVGNSISISRPKFSFKIRTGWPFCPLPFLNTLGHLGCVSCSARSQELSHLFFVMVYAWSVSSVDN